MVQLQNSWYAGGALSMRLAAVDWLCFKAGQDAVYRIPQSYRSTMLDRGGSTWQVGNGTGVSPSWQPIKYQPP
jgi:hypothetical protein